MQLKDLVEKTLLDQRLSYRAAAKKTGVSHATIQKIVDGSTTYRKSTETLMALSGGLGIPIEEMWAAILGVAKAETQGSQSPATIAGDG